MIQLVVSDIDGTLLQDGANAIPPAIFEQIARLKERGIRFCPASGRQYTSLRKLFAPVADQLYYLCENGAVVYGPGAPGPILSRTEMDWDLSLELCREILAHPRCEVLISGANTSYLCPKEGDIVSLIRDFVGNNVALLPRPEDMPEPFVKVSAYCRDGARGVEPELAPRWSGHFHAAVAGEKWLDFTLADKGVGVLGLCRSMGIDPKDVLAFGDNWNDAAMLSVVGHPYLMAAAEQGLLEQFPTTCHRVEDVLRYFLDTNQLP